MFKDNTFSYFQRPSDLNVSAVRNSSGKGRIRVAAGDKCVAPAKSRPKKRKTLGGTDQSGLSMDAVEWSDKSFTVRELVQTFGSAFPLLVKVTQGYYGEISIEYSVDQVLQLHSFGEQERIKATDLKGRTLSMPLDYNVEVQVYDRQSTETKKLEDAVRKYPLPVRFHVIRALKEVNRDVVNLIGEKVTVLDCHEELFLRGNSIMDGWINQSEIALLPEFMGMEFAVAVGMRGASPEEWSDYQNMFARSVRSMHFQRIAGYDGVVVMEPGSPVQEGQTSIPYSPQTNLPQTGQIYENIPLQNKPKKKGPDLVPSLEKERGLQGGSSIDRPRKHNYENVKLESTVSSENNKNQYDKVIIQQPIDTSGSKSPPTAPKPSRDKLRRRNDADVIVHREDVTSPVGMRSNRTGDTDSVDDLDVTQMFDNVLKVAQETLDRDNNQSKAKPGKSSAVKPTPQSSGFVNSGYSQTPPETRHNSAQSQAPRAVVQPTVQNGRGPYVISFSLKGSETPDNNNIPLKPTNRNDSSDSSSKYKSIEDLPHDIDTLTVEEVCDCLKLLNMDAHIPSFRRHQIDGGLLSGLKETVLQSDFGFTPFNASKLTRFARGWRPKLS